MCAWRRKHDNFANSAGTHKDVKPIDNAYPYCETCHSSRAHNDIVKQLYQFYSITNNGSISFIVKEEDLSTFVQMSSSSPEVVQDLLYCEASI